MTNMELPWLKDYLKETKDTKELWVIGLIDGANGLLVITHHWKAFVFARDKRYSQLKEAIPIWLAHNEPLPRLVAKPATGGKVAIGFDDEMVDSYWKEIEPGKYFNGLADGSTPATGETDLTEQPPRNPFLPGSTPAANTPQKRKPAQRNIQGEASKMP